MRIAFNTQMLDFPEGTLFSILTPLHPSSCSAQYVRGLFVKGDNSGDGFSFWANQIIDTDQSCDIVTCSKKINSFDISPNLTTPTFTRDRDKEIRFVVHEHTTYVMVVWDIESLEHDSSLTSSLNYLRDVKVI